MVKISKRNKKKEVLYVSVFRNYKKSVKIFKDVTYGDFFSNDPYFFKWLDNFCLQNNLKINMLHPFKSALKKYYIFFLLYK